MLFIRLFPFEIQVVGPGREVITVHILVEAIALPTLSYVNESFFFFFAFFGFSLSSPGGSLEAPH